MDGFYAYTTSGWLALQATSLLFMPRIIVSTLSTEMHKYPTPLETYFARALGFALLTMALLSLVMMGSIPLSASEPISLDDSDDKAPYAFAVLFVTTIFHACCAIYVYTWYSAGGQAGFLLGLVGYASLAALGLWCIMFGSGPGRISKRTGADKRTSGFPFKNVESDKKVGKRKGI